MQRMLITIGQDQYNDDQIRSLEQIVRQHYRKLVYTGKLKVLWNLVPQGNAFRGYGQKPPVLIDLGCPVGFSQQKREVFFKQCTQDWVAIVGGDPDELLITVIEQPKFKTYISRNNKYLSTIGKLRWRFHVLKEVVKTKTRKGYAAFVSSY